MRLKLELILREEEELQSLNMYRRDKRLRGNTYKRKRKLGLDRIILDMLHCPMRMHEKVLTILYEEILNGKTKNEVNGREGSSKRKKKVVGEDAIGQ